MYRRLKVNLHQAQSRKEHGVEIRQYQLVVRDSGDKRRPVFVSEPCEMDDARDSLTEYLNYIGRDGWRVLYFAPKAGSISHGGGTLAEDWPVGTHVLVREGETAPDER